MPGAFDNAVFRFDSNPLGVFYSGQVISGSVLFDLERPISIQVLYIQYLGVANVLWTENETETINGVERQRMVKYNGHEEYFNASQELAGTSQLPTGAQAFPFKFQIPPTCPSSFKGEQGSVSYSITVHLVYADPALTKEELNKNIQIVAPFDLNLGSPRIRQPIDLEFEEVYGCGCFCSSDPVTIRVRLPISGYCPGQAIPVSVEVENESSVEITKMVFQLVSKELYRSQRPRSEYILPEKILVTAKKGPVMAHCKRNFTCDLVVPDMIVPYLENCSIIDLGYFFRITIKLSGCNDELSDEAELCLGLIPVREFTEGEYVHPMAPSLPVGAVPVCDTAALAVPPAAGLNESTNSLQKLQYNQVQTAAYQNYPNNPIPYPTANQPYPTDNRFQTPVSKPQPFCDYAIGFKTPEGSIGNVPYPSNVPTVGAPPYPTQNLMPGVATPPYPTDNMMPQINSGLPPYSQGAFAPSAPPPTDLHIYFKP